MGVYERYKTISYTDSNQNVSTTSLREFIQSFSPSDIANSSSSDIANSSKF